MIGKLNKCYGLRRNIKKLQSRSHVSGSCLIGDGPTKVVPGTHCRLTKLNLQLVSQMGIYTNILNDTSNVTDRVFAIFSKLCKTFNPKFQGSAKIYEMGLRSKIIRVNLFYTVH